MIDTSQLTSLVSAFRVETDKESISPETVGKLLQDIVDLLATASSDTERKILDDWKALLSQYTVVYDVAHATGMADIKQGVGNATKIFLSLTKHDVRTGEDFPNLGTCQIAAATANQAGAMTAAHVTSLANAKTDITALQSAMRKVQGAGCVVKGAMVYHLDTNIE